MSEWWQTFFSPITAEVMFDTREKKTDAEIAQVLKQTKIKPQAKILDLACGTGRHSLRLAKKNFDVVGLDFTASFLREARKKANGQKKKPRFVRGDMKNLKPHFKNEQFELVLSLFNSFGYFNKRSDDIKMLREVYRVLKPGGKFVINTLNAERVVQVLPIERMREPLKNVKMLDKASFNKKTKSTLAEWVITDTRGARTKVFHKTFRQNVYTHKELATLLKIAGFKIEKTWGLLPGGPFRNKTTWHQTILAYKVR